MEAQKKDKQKKAVKSMKKKAEAMKAQKKQKKAMKSMKKKAEAMKAQKKQKKAMKSMKKKAKPWRKNRRKPKANMLTWETAQAQQHADLRAYLHLYFLKLQACKTNIVSIPLTAGLEALANR